MILERNIKTNFTAILWESVAEPEALAKDESKWASQSRRYRAIKHMETTEGQRWLGADNVAQLQQRLKTGWPEGVQQIEEISVRQLTTPTSIRRRRVKGDQGDELDMQAVYRGDLSRAWTKTRRQTRAAIRTVNIVIDLGASGGTNSDQLFWRGASALKVAQQLSESGYNVAMYGAVGVKQCDADAKMGLAQLVEIKSEDSPMDMDKLAALTAMAGFFRTSLFAGISYATDNCGKDAAYGMGSADPSAIAKAVKMLPIPQNVIIQAPVLDRASAEAWIDTVLASIETPTLAEAE